MDRSILHVDMNACYASIECLYDPSIRDKPVAVGGDAEARHGIILAKNQIAKKFGVTTGEALWQAKQKCPQLVIIKPHYDRYLRFSALARQIYNSYTDQVESFGLDECWLDVSGSVHLFGDSTVIAEEIRERVKRELGITVSVGVSYNKVFAKLGSDLKKPDAVSVLTRDNYRDKVWPLPASDLLYVGRATTRKLYNHGIETIGQLANTDIVYANVYFDCTAKESERQSKKPYVVDCYLDMRDGFSQLRIRCISPDWPTYQAEKAIPDTLIPDLPKAQLEATATKILRELYPAALRNAIPVPASAIARKLGLSVQYACIDTDGEVLGKIFFEDSTTAVQDSPGGMNRILNVARGTILVNHRLDSRYDSRIYNNTIVHECVHWMLHRQAYQLQKANDPQITSIACRRSSALGRSREWTPQERMEWQANALAPRILMPEWSTRMLTDQWIRRMEKLDPKYRMDRIVEKLSCHFEVSRSLARIRLIELGYPDAELGYTAPTQFEISYPDATREFSHNSKFRDALATGAYSYVDQRFCLRNNRYISRAEDGTLHLTEYAKAHPAECCIGFDVQRRARWVNDGMLRDRGKVPQFAEAATEIQQECWRGIDGTKHDEPDAG